MPLLSVVPSFLGKLNDMERLLPLRLLTNDRCGASCTVESSLDEIIRRKPVGELGELLS